MKKNDDARKAMQLFDSSSCHLCFGKQQKVDKILLYCMCTDQDEIDYTYSNNDNVVDLSYTIQWLLIKYISCNYYSDKQV